MGRGGRSGGRIEKGLYLYLGEPLHHISHHGSALVLRPPPPPPPLPHPLLATTPMPASVLGASPPSGLTPPPVQRAPARPPGLQVLGRNLEALINRAMELQSKMGDQFVSIEHLVLALADDAHFGEALFKSEGLTKDKLEGVRGGGGRREGCVSGCVCVGVCVCWGGGGGGAGGHVRAGIGRARFDRGGGGADRPLEPVDACVGVHGGWSGGGVMGRVRAR